MLRKPVTYHTPGSWFAEGEFIGTNEVDLKLSLIPKQTQTTILLLS